MADYDFDAMRLNTDACIKAIKVSPLWLQEAFDWHQTPQGPEYWSHQATHGLDMDAKSTVAYFVAQKIEMEMAPFTAGMRF